MKIYGVYGHEISHLFPDGGVWNEQGTLELDTTNYGGDVPAVFTYGGTYPTTDDPNPEWPELVKAYAVLAWGTFTSVRDRLKTDEHQHSHQY